MFVYININYNLFEFYLGDISNIHYTYIYIPLAHSLRDLPTTPIKYTRYLP